MKIGLHLLLPRESRFVPLLRTTASQFLVDLGVAPADIEDVELILSEACANVVRHAVETSQYSVDVTVRNTGCTIVVQDEGPGFDPASVGERRVTAESGRGLALIDALVDHVTFSEMDGDHRVRLDKQWADPIDGDAN